MFVLLESPEFWKAIASMLWPIVVLIVFISARSRHYAFLNRDNLSIKVAGMEISVADATKNLGSDVSDLQKRLSDLEIEFGRLTEMRAEVSINGHPVENADSPTPASPQSPSHSFSILWVDDYPSNNAFLVEQLQREGIEIKLALTTNEGLQDFRNGDFGLVITDLGRQEGGISKAYAGLELIKQIVCWTRTSPSLCMQGTRRNAKPIADC